MRRGDAASAELSCAPPLPSPSGDRHSRHIYMRRPSGALPPIGCKDSPASSGLLNNGCQSSKERFKITFQFPFLPSSSVLTSALFFRADECFRPRVFHWIDVFEHCVFVLLKEHDGVRFPIPRSCQADCQRLTSCRLSWPESNSLLLFTRSSPE